MQCEMPSSRWCRIFIASGLSALISAPGLALAQTQADLSVSAVVSPPYFIPGGRHTIALTVHNAGPSAVDSGSEYSVSVFGDTFTITHKPPPYEVLVDTAQGCWADRFVIELVPPNYDTLLLFAYDFGALPAGGSLTCTYEAEFYPSTTEPFTFGWQVDTHGTGFSIDPNPSNNTFSYTLNGKPSVPPAPVPIGSLPSWLFLCIGLAGLNFREVTRRRKHLASDEYRAPGGTGSRYPSSLRTRASASMKRSTSSRVL